MEEKKKHEFIFVKRIIQLLKILKEETDERTPISQTELACLSERTDNPCPIRTLWEYMPLIVDGLNPEELNPPKPKKGEQKKKPKNTNIEDYKLLVRGLEERLQARAKGVEAEEGKLRICEMRFNHTFSFDELDQLVEAVLFLKNIDDIKKERLIRKLQTLSSRHYPKYSAYINSCTGEIKAVQSVFEDSRIDESAVKRNLQLIQEAFDSIEKKGAKISFHFNGYNRKKELEPRCNPDGSRIRYVVDPYYVLIYNGKYYLVCSMEPHRNVSIYRIDLMSDISCKTGVSVKDKSTPKTRMRRPKSEIKGLPEEWNAAEAKKFQSEHLYMFYGEAEEIILKLDRERYTLLHDYFGDYYEYRRSIDERWDEVQVSCVPDAMLRWAMQCSDYVEILEPVYLREKMRTRCEELAKRYQS